jgi:hypothetical protein
MPSQVIQAYSYDDATETLFITFTSGELYAYRPVPAAVVKRFAAAGSRGRFFAYNIRNRYAYTKLEAGAA